MLSIWEYEGKLKKLEIEVARLKGERDGMAEALRAFAKK